MYHTSVWQFSGYQQQRVIGATSTIEFALNSQNAHLTYLGLMLEKEGRLPSESSQGVGSKLGLSWSTQMAHTFSVADLGGGKGSANAPPFGG